MAGDCIWTGTVSTNPAAGGNWSTGVVPAVGDDVIIPAGATQNIIGGDLSGVAIASLVIEDGCAISIGTGPLVATPEPLMFGGNATCYVNDWGSGTRYLYCMDTASWNMLGSGTVYIDGINNDELNIKPNGTANVVVGPGYAAAVPIVPAEFDAIGYIEGGTVELRSVTTQAAGAVPITGILGGKVTARSALTNVYQYGGTLAVEAVGITNFYSTGGTCTYNSDDTITLFVIEGSGRLDFGREPTPVTVTQGQVHRGGTVLDPYGRVIWTNEIELIRCSLTEVILDLGRNREYQVTAL